MRHFHLYHSQMHSAAQHRNSKRHMRPIARLLSFLSARAVSSTTDVSRSPHSADSMSRDASADRADMGGVGSRVELNPDASSSRVSFISAFKREKGWEMMLSSLLRNSSSDGILEFRRTRDCSKSLGIVTLDRRESSGMVNCGMEMSMPMSEVARYGSASELEH